MGHESSLALQWRSKANNVLKFDPLYERNQTMSTRPIFLANTPMIPTGGTLADALKFFTEQMGFSILWQSAGGAGIRRDAVAFNLVENDNREWAQNASFSIAVSNLDALYEEYRNINAKVGPLGVKPWGRREFHMIIPSGVCLQFYGQD
jgi:hypothetical protein